MANCSIEKTVKSASGKIPYAYDLSQEELAALYESSQISVIQALISAYYYGFARGTRARARNRVSKL